MIRDCANLNAPGKAVARGQRLRFRKPEFRVAKVLARDVLALNQVGINYCGNGNK